MISRMMSEVPSSILLRAFEPHLDLTDRPSPPA